LADICQSEILEHNFCADQVIFLGQHVNNFRVRYSADHADGLALQFVYAINGRARRRNDQYDHMADDYDSLRLGQVTNVAANHGEINFIC